jgi:hydroxyacylglutathione hydrolase
MKINENFHFLYGLFSANVGIIRSSGEIALVDSGFTEETVDMIAAYLDLVEDSKEIKYVFLTHGDPDHIGGIHRFHDEYKAKVVIHTKEAEKIQNPPPFMPPSKADITIDQDKTFLVGDLEMKLIVTPGHSSGSVCVYNRKHQILFTGDTIVGPSYSLKNPPWEGHARLLNILPVRAGMDTYIDSLRRLCHIKTLWLLPGHGKPIFKKGRERMIETIAVVRDLKDRTRALLKEELCPSELAIRLNAHELVMEETVKELLKERRIEYVRSKCVKEESCYKSL